MGTPLKMDDATIYLFQVVYARVLIDVDISKQMPEKILASMKTQDNMDVSFYVGVTYEYLPKFCGTCRVIGHGDLECRKQQQRLQPMNRRVNGRREVPGDITNREITELQGWHAKGVTDAAKNLESIANVEGSQSKNPEEHANDNGVATTTVSGCQIGYVNPIERFDNNERVEETDIQGADKENFVGIDATRCSSTNILSTMGGLHREAEVADK